MTPDMLGGGGPPGGGAPGGPPGGAPPGGVDPMLQLAMLNRKGRKGPKRHKGKKKAK